jgi:heat shock protein HslJ
MLIRPLLLLFLSLTVFVGLSCQNDASKSGGGGPEARPFEIEDVTWQLTEIGGKPAEPVPADAQAPFLRLSTADRRASGYSSVNNFGGTYELSGASLRFSGLAMTRRAGPDNLMRQESVFSAALNNTVAWRAAGYDSIELLDVSGNVLARLTRAG